MAEEHQLISCPSAVVATTLGMLQDAGAEGCECVVLWLSNRGSGTKCIVEAYRPEQRATENRFWIPEAGMTALMRHLRSAKLSLAAQVHSHPRRAFHSEIDDANAVVRHEGGLSIVVPYFGSELTPATFVEHSAFFSLNGDDKWEVVKRDDVASYFKIASLK
jgi:hypothetical protein